MATYKQRPGNDTWHWCRNCSNYPSPSETGKTHTGGRPTTGELCNQCLSKERAGTCSL